MGFNPRRLWNTRGLCGDMGAGGTTFCAGWESGARAVCSLTLQAEPRILESSLCKHQRPAGTVCQRGVMHIANYEIGSRSMPTWLPFKLLSKYKVVLRAFTYTASTLRPSPAFRTINTLWLAARFAGTSGTWTFTFCPLPWRVTTRLVPSDFTETRYCPAFRFLPSHLTS